MADGRAKLGSDVDNFGGRARELPAFRAEGRISVETNRAVLRLGRSSSSIQFDSRGEGRGETRGGVIQPLAAQTR